MNRCTRPCPIRVKGLIILLPVDPAVVPEVEIKSDLAGVAPLDVRHPALHQVPIAALRDVAPATELEYEMAAVHHLGGINVTGFGQSVVQPLVYELEVGVK